jgi:LAO/AO transport system kinase
VAVLAVDPSSKISGGSIMGDKTRMDKLSASPSSFIRPSPSSGSLGGVARKTRETMLICEAADYDVIIIETVGVGQSEVMVASMVDFFLVMMLPNAGDELQGIKKGIMEFADSIIVNKADGENIDSAKRAKAQYENVLHILSKTIEEWEPMVLTCSSVKNWGIKEFTDILYKHNDIMKKTGNLEDKRKQQRKEWMWNILQNVLQSMFRRNSQVSHLLRKLETKVLSGETTPTKAASMILDEFVKNVSKVDTFWDVIND